MSKTMRGRGLSSISQYSGRPLYLRSDLTPILCVLRLFSSHSFVHTIEFATYLPCRLSSEVTR